MPQEQKFPDGRPLEKFLNVRGVHLVEDEDEDPALLAYLPKGKRGETL